MALDGNEGMVMPVSPMYGGNGSGFGSGFGDGSGWWILLLFILLGGWNNGFGGNGNSTPYVVGNTVQDGFNQAALTSGIGDIQSALCNGFAGVNSNVANGFAQAEIADNSRQIANMQQSFANQTAMSSGFNALQSQLASCCCESRLSSANLQNVIQSENCADRSAISDGIKDLLVASNNNTQRILDQLCSDKIDAKNERIADLERQLTMANLSASQNTQTQTLLADNFAQTSALEQYLAPVPRPAYIVQNPNCCAQNVGCGCGSY